MIRVQTSSAVPPPEGGGGPVRAAAGNVAVPGSGPVVMRRTSRNAPGREGVAQEPTDNAAGAPGGPVEVRTTRGGPGRENVERAAQARLRIRAPQGFRRALRRRAADRVG